MTNIFRVMQDRCQKLLAGLKSNLLSILQSFAPCYHRQQSEFEAIRLQTIYPSVSDCELSKGENVCFEIGGKVYLGKILDNPHEVTVLPHLIFHQPILANYCHSCLVLHLLQQSQSASCKHNYNQDKKESYSEKNDSQNKNERLQEFDCSHNNLFGHQLCTLPTDRNDCIDSRQSKENPESLAKRQRLTCHKVTIDLYKLSTKNNDKSVAGDKK